jgi:hypothetical protein
VSSEADSAGVATATSVSSVYGANIEVSGNVAVTSDADSSDNNASATSVSGISATNTLIISGVSNTANSSANGNASSASILSVSAGNEGVGGDITIGEINVTSDAIGGSAIAVANAGISADDVTINGPVNVSANAGVTASNEEPVNTESVQVLDEGSSSAVASAVLNINSVNTSVAGDVTVVADANNAADAGTASSIADANILADIDIALAGIVVSSNALAQGETSSVADLEVDAGENLVIIDDVTVSSNASTSGESGNANASAIANLSGVAGVNASGDVGVSANASSSAISTANSTLNVVAGSEGELPVISDAIINGAITSLANATGGEGTAATGYAKVQATNDIILSSLVPDPRVQANTALVQQRVSGVSTVGSDTATLVLTAGGVISFVPTNPDDVDINNLGGFGEETGDIEGNTTQGLGNLEPAGGDNVDCDYMNCDESAV